MKVAAVLLLALAAPASACGMHFSTMELALIDIVFWFSVVVGVVWLGGLLARALGFRGAADRALAYATLSVGAAQVALASTALAAISSQSLSRLKPDTWAAVGIVSVAVCPLLAWWWIGRSDGRGGRVVRRAGSPVFPLLAGTAALFGFLNTPLVGTPLAFTPVLALFAVLIDSPAASPARPVVSPLTLSPGHCPVCRELVADRVSECTRCRTPHHRECLEFNGRCGIFACQPGAPDPTAKKKV